MLCFEGNTARVELYARNKYSKQVLRRRRSAALIILMNTAHCASFKGF